MYIIALWAVFTSIPQPICAVPAYMFVERMLYSLPFGLGFAAGAMGYIAIAELLAEAIELTSLLWTILIGTLSFASMCFVQDILNKFPQ